MEIIAVIFGYSFIGAFVGFAVYSISMEMGLFYDLEDLAGLAVGLFWPIGIPIVCGIMLAFYCIRRMFFKKEKR